MKAKMTAWINILLTAILGLLGYSCKEVRCEYGVPSADFTLEGSVCNEEGEALSCIQIVRRGGWKDGAGTLYWDEWSDTLYTNAEGRFYKRYNGDFPLEYYRVIANDTSNVYASDSIDTSVTYSGGDNRWYLGATDLKADFVLKKK